MERLVLIAILLAIGAYSYYYSKNNENMEKKHHLMFSGTLVVLIAIYGYLYWEKNKEKLEKEKNAFIKKQQDKKVSEPASSRLPLSQPSSSNMPHFIQGQDVNIPSDETPFGNVKLINYHTNWCPASKAFLPIWNELANQVRLKYPFIRVQDVVCEGSEKFRCDAEGIDGYPDVVLYIGNKRLQYNGTRNIVAMMTFITNNLETAGIY